tara:strand:- start:29451 stop:30674 length:1224 start_codon:yes stop_codon:yes gene_type:complete
LCGIVGVIGSSWNERVKVFKQLLYVGTLRGFDSTGIFKVGVGGSVEMYKKAVSAPDFLDFKHVDDIINSFGSVLVGHNRAATKGKVNNVNAHPFQFDNITGVHNGTLTHRHKLDDYRDFEVDSENLFYHLQRNGLQDTLDNCDGAYALVWHDSEEKTINLYRNKERPLHYAYSEDRKSLYWASEGEMLEWILEKNHVNYQEIIPLKPHQLLTLPVPEVGSKLQPTLKMVYPAPPPNSKVVPFKGKPFPSSLENSFTGVDGLYERGEDVTFTIEGLSRNKYHQEFIWGYSDDGYGARVRVFLQQRPELRSLVKGTCSFIGAISKAPTDEWLTVSPSSVVELEEEGFLGYNNRDYTKEELNKRLSNGCSWCTKIEKEGSCVHWISDDEYLCVLCQRDPDIQYYINQEVN